MSNGEAVRPRVNEVFIRGKRHYEIPNGDVVPSVTTFLDVLPKPALLNWKVKATAEWAVKFADVWAKYDEETGLVVPRGPHQAAVDMIKNATEYDTTARDNGSIVHKILEDLFLGREPVVPPGFERVIDIFEEIRKDFDIEPMYLEPQLINYKYRYSGSTDAIFRINGKITLIDYKAGNGLYGSTAYQTTAYARSETILLPDGDEIEMPQVEQLMGFWVRPSGYAAFPLEYSQDTWDVVRAARRLYDLTAREYDYRGRPVNPNPIKTAGPQWGE